MNVQHWLVTGLPWFPSMINRPALKLFLLLTIHLKCNIDTNKSVMPHLRLNNQSESHIERLKVVLLWRHMTSNSVAENNVWRTSETSASVRQFGWHSDTPFHAAHRTFSSGWEPLMSCQKKRFPGLGTTHSFSCEKWSGRESGLGISKATQ